MKKGKFTKVAATEQNEAWDKMIKRDMEFQTNENEVRSPFARDYTRILHSLAYRRLKQKTQVFFNIDNDHICTRMEHVAHVESISSTIAQCLGLNAELTKAISVGHDIGHAPFGHHGEQVIKALMIREHFGTTFWHEKNGLRFVDNIELLENSYNRSKNLNLTYAVRDGIVSHCGEVDENGLVPREEYIDLESFSQPGEYQPFTWEGCVVKVADKIAYIGRDIEDAICLGFLDEDVKNRLEVMARVFDQRALNTTVITNNLIIDICKNSSPEKGICLSDTCLQQLDEIKDFNYKYIYKHKRLKAFQDYSSMIITNIFDILLECYDGKHTWENLENEVYAFSPTLAESFSKFLTRYCDSVIIPHTQRYDLKPLALKCENKKIYGDLGKRETYIQAIFDFIAGMTDRFAIKIFEEFLKY